MTDKPAKISISMNKVGEIVWEIYETYRAEDPEKALSKYLALAGEYLASGQKLHEIYLVRDIFLRASFIETQLSQDAIFRSLENFLCELEQLCPDIIIHLTNIIELTSLKNGYSEKWVKGVIFSVFMSKKFMPTESLNKLHYLDSVERYTFANLIKKVESAKNIAEFYEKTAPEISETVATIRDKYRIKKPVGEMEPKICFYIWGDATTAHFENLFNFFRYAKQFGYSLEKYVVLGRILGDSKFFENTCSEIGVKYVLLPFIDKPLEDALYLKSVCLKLNAASIVFISVLTRMQIYASFKLAPKQIFWAMKYHDYTNLNIDFFIGQAILGIHPIYANTKWKFARGAYSTLFDLTKEEKAKKIRANLGGNYRILAGILGRSEKMQSKEYLESICNLLKTNSDTLFIWSGRTEIVEVTDFFEKNGVLDQTKFIGWVDTFLYAQVLDVQLDTFPFASGFTSARVMGAGKPVVTLCTQESVTSSLATYHKIFVSDLVPEEIRRDYEEIFTFENGNVTYPFCEKIEEYEELSDKIIRDDDFRKNLGCRCRKWVEKYFLDHKSSAVTTVELLDEVSGL